MVAPLLVALALVRPAAVTAAISGYSRAHSSRGIRQVIIDGLDPRG